MKRWDHLLAAVREFEPYLSKLAPKPFTIVRAWDEQWSSEECGRLTPAGYPMLLTGVYFYVDICTAGDIHGTPADGSEQFTVIRKLGKATKHFYDRVRKAHWKQPGGQFRLFRHRWIDIIPIGREFSFVTCALENFLLQRIRTEMDKQDVPRSLLLRPPQIYDEES